MAATSCPDCHHHPSGRHAGPHAARCYCQCHDVADAAPDLLEALLGIIAITDRKTVEWDKAHAAIAKAEGK